MESLEAGTSKIAHSSKQQQGWVDAGVAGVGIGLRGVHLHEVLQTRPPIPWFEILADNYMTDGGPAADQLRAIRGHYPVTFHCVGLSLGGIDDLDAAYLHRLKGMHDRYEPAWVSDHLCFTRCNGRHYHDLLPIPYSEEALAHVAQRVMRVQETLGEAMLIENVSSYLRFHESSLSEAEFLAELCARTDCHLLLDVNNMYVNYVNHGVDPMIFLYQLPLESVRELHLGGYEDKGSHLLDAHNHPVSEPVWGLYRHCVQLLPQVPTLIEWDNDIPAFSVLRKEAERAERCRQAASACPA